MARIFLFCLIMVGCGDQRDSDLQYPYQPYGSHSFPLSGPAWQDYTTGGVAFGACRESSCSRIHAGVDLVHALGTPIYAVSSGEIVDFHYFYQGTYAVVIDHGDFVVRYSEVDGSLPNGISVGKKVIRGQLIARIGDLEGTSNSMLHFEMYTGEATGPLTTNRKPYNRRWDLVNPTAKLVAWPYPRR